MNQKTLIIGGIIVIVLVVLGIWYFSSSTPAGTGAQETATTSVSTVSTNVPSTAGAATPANPSTFASIFAQSGNHECDYSQSSVSGQSTSVIYISDGKMRGEFRSTMSGTPTASLMIYNGGYLYNWNEGATTGKKSSIKSLADLPAIIPQDLTSASIFGTASDTVGWNCHNWVTDPTVFVIPTYVTFSVGS